MERLLIEVRRVLLIGLVWRVLSFVEAWQGLQMMRPFVVRVCLAERE